MSDRRHTLGKRGEDLAAAHLQKEGMQIIARNYRQKTGEIDIIARDGEYLVFVEVKTRSNKNFGHPFEAVSRKKQSQICRVAMDYMSRHNILDHAARFDVVSIVFPGHGKGEIEHLADCFDFV